MFRQLEATSEHELLSTIGYLFTVRASKWLRVNYYLCATWENFKRALRVRVLVVDRRLHELEWEEDEIEALESISREVNNAGTVLR